MFKFLRKKLKKFEDKLEAELQVELEKETEGVEPEEPVEKPELETTDEEKIVVKEPKDKIAGPKPRELTDSKIGKLVKKPKKSEELTRRRRIEKRRREEHIDKQIEKSIETELEHTLRTRRSIEDVVKTDRKTSRGISEEKLNDLLWDLEVGLLESDVAYSVIESIKNDIKEELKYVSFERSKVSELVENVLRNAIEHVLKSSEMDFDEFIDNSKKPVVIMFVGVNGSGKTLSIGKMATLLKKRGKSSVMAAGDTFRAGAIEQLGIWIRQVECRQILILWMRWQR
jgi:fused signal recognition particle receptor